MIPSLKNFEFHKLVIAREIIVNNDVKSATTYVDGVQDALAPEVANDPTLKTEVDNLDGFLGILRGVEEFAEENKLTTLEILKLLNEQS